MPIFTTIALIVACAFFLFSMFMLVRNTVVYRARTRRLSELRELIDSPDWHKAYALGWNMSHDDYNRHSYEALLFAIHKWTYRQFYPRSVWACVLNPRSAND